MRKHRLLLHPLFSSNFKFQFVLIVAITMIVCVANVSGQSKESPTKANSEETRLRPAEILPDVLSDWKATGTPKTLSPDQLKALPNADVLSEYGLQSVITRSYAKAKNKITVEVYAMSYNSGAFGLFTFNRKLLPQGSQEFYQHRYVVRVTDPSQINAVDQQFIQAVRNQLRDEQGQLPPLPQHLPEQNKVPESEIYLTGSNALSKLSPFSDLAQVLDLTGGVEIVTAEYVAGSERMNLILVDCYTPQLAKDNFARLQNYLESLPSEEKARRLIKRPGNYVVEIVNASDINAAQSILDQIKYGPRVYWEGDRFTSIPYEYRPPDPLTIEEARRTGTFLATTFYMIGLMIVGSVLLGIVSGGAFFYWRRYRRRKLGLEDAFSDAGGTIRLNLDDYLLTSGTPQSKLLKEPE